MDGHVLAHVRREKQRCVSHALLRTNGCPSGDKYDYLAIGVCIGIFAYMGFKIEANDEQLTRMI